MTLIITALADDAVVQVSDRRLTCPDGSDFAENANKAICFDCADAHVSLAYTGLAQIGATRTDHWLVDLLTDHRLTSESFPVAVEAVARLATERFRALRHLGNRRPLSLVFGGFGPRGPLMALVSNFEDSSGKRLPSVSDTFGTAVGLRNQHLMRRLGLMVSGAEAAVTTELTDAIKRIRKRFLTERPEKRVNVLVQVLRRAAAEPKHGWLIGNECMAVIVTPAGGFQATFHPSEESEVSYMPHYVRPGMSACDIWISTDENQRPPRAPPQVQ
jgi:hypothetical protein